jgi:hypothetical protein
MHFYNVGYTESGLCVGGEGVSWILDGSCMDWKEDAGLKMHLFIHLIPHLVGSLFWRALFFYLSFGLLFVCFCFYHFAWYRVGKHRVGGKHWKWIWGRREYDYLLVSFFFCFFPCLLLGMPTVDPAF